MIEKSIVLQRSPEEAFKLFTARLSEWWPPLHRPSKDPESTLRIDPGGRFWECARDGREFEPGHVLSWEPPHRLTVDFYMGTGSAQPTSVEVTFTAEEGGMRVAVQHRAKPESQEIWDKRVPIFHTSLDAVRSRNTVTSVLPSNAMKSFQVSTEIRATPAVIWRILTNASQYTVSNSTVDKVEGSIEPGKQVTVYTKLNPGRAFPVKVTEFVPSTRMVWSGGMPLGLFKGERVFTLTERHGGLVDFHMSEPFSGLISPLIERSIPDLQLAFNDFAADLADLKKRTEAAGTY